MPCCLSSRISVATEPPPEGDLFLNPFVADSGHHRPIGSDAVYAGDNHEWTLNWRQAPKMGLNISGTFGPFGRFCYKTTSASPRVTILRNPIHEDAYLNIPAGGVFDVPYPSEGVVVHQLANNNDSEGCFLDPDTGYAYELRECGPAVGNAPYTYLPSNPVKAAQLKNWWARKSGTGSTGATAGLGHGIAMGERIGHSASGTSALFGVLRGHDITGPNPIGHVLQLVLPRRDTHVTAASWSGQTVSQLLASSTHGHILSKEIWLPATSRDGTAGNAGENLGKSPYGAVFAVVPVSKGGPDLNSFGFDAQQMKVAVCMRDFGMTGVDGGGGAKIRCDQNWTSALRNKVVTVLNLLQPHLRLVINDGGWDPSNRRRPVGGGTPIARNTAYDA